jgi:hypothetical protein
VKIGESESNLAQNRKLEGEVDRAEPTCCKKSLKINTARAALNLLLLGEAKATASHGSFLI